MNEIRVHLDFESRSEADIWAVGAYEYSRHPSTEVLCICYTVNDDWIRTIRRENIKVNEFDTYLYNLAANPNAICNFKLI